MPKQSKNDDLKKDVEKTTKKQPLKRAKNRPKTTPKSDGKKRGAKSQYENKVKPYLEDIARYTRCGVTEGQLCSYYDVSKTQWAEYKHKFPELTETLKKAKEQFKTELVNTAYKVANGYEYIEIKTVEEKDPSGTITGTITTTQKRYAKPDPAMIQFLLINRFFDDFARDPQATALRKRALDLAEQGKLPPDGGEGV